MTQVRPGRWEGRITVGSDANGRLIRRKVTARTKRELIEWMRAAHAEVQAFIVAIRGHRLEAAFFLALGCGLRVSELGGLAWPDVHLDPKGVSTISIRRGLKLVAGRGRVAEEVKTARSRRVLHLPEPVVNALIEHRRRQRSDRLRTGAGARDSGLGHNFVFRTVTGLPVDGPAFWKELAAVSERAGFGHWHPHELRHSAASLMFAANVPLKVVSETLGHSSITITADIYAHLLGASRQQAADAMTAALSAPA